MCLVDTFERLSRAADRQAGMRRAVVLAGGYCETVNGEADEARGETLGLPTGTPLTSAAQTAFGPGAGVPDVRVCERCGATDTLRVVAVRDGRDVLACRGHAAALAAEPSDVLAALAWYQSQRGARRL
ncbi:hypothetical protein ACH44C_15140 [Streptomyces purpureus]|uniref:hypothetical protein n=1 Tax=Streptomyces purpureus TaxID=1951 RepID=UPI003788BD18